MGNALSWRRAAACLGVMALMAVAPAPLHAQTPPERQEPRPLDPLTPAERELATRLVTGDARVRRIAGGRETDAAYVELLIQKPAESAGRPRRMAEVLVTAIGGEPGGVRAVVDLSSQTIVEVASAAGVRPTLAPGGSPGRETVPISPREAAFAQARVMSDAGFRQMMSALPEGMRQQEVTTEFLPIITPEELCPSGRCVEVLFRRGRGYLTTTAVVELSTGTVRYRGRRQ